LAGRNPRGVFSGAYDPAVAGRIRWSVTPELDLSSVSAAGISGSNGYLRVRILWRGSAPDPVARLRLA
jgi:hypothetical protein